MFPLPLQLGQDLAVILLIGLFAFGIVATLYQVRRGYVDRR